MPASLICRNGDIVLHDPAVFVVYAEFARHSPVGVHQEVFFTLIIQEFFFSEKFVFPDRSGRFAFRRSSPRSAGNSGAREKSRDET